MEKSLCVAIPENAMSLMHIIFDQIKCFTKIFSIYLYMILSIFIYEQNISGHTYVPGGVSRLSILGSAVQVEMNSSCDTLPGS